MVSKENQSKGKRILKGLGITLVALLGLVGFAFIEVAMSGSNLDSPPSQGLIWLLMIVTDMAVMVVLIKLISRV